MFKHSLILAAGRGVRLKPFTEKKPKALLPIENTTLINQSIQKINKYISNIHVTVGYKGNILAKYLIGKKIASIINTEDQDNSWWVFNSLLKYLNEPLLVLTCDNITKINYRTIFNEFKKYDKACMIVPVRPVEGLDGDYIFSKKNLITKLSRYEISNIYASGIQVINPCKINKIVKQKKNNFNDLWKFLIKKKKLALSKYKPKNWYTIDSLKNLKEFKKKLT